jgi:hypothetical protein
MSFRLHFSNPTPLVPVPELYEDYDLESAFYDYFPDGMRVTLEIDSFTLEQRRHFLVFVVRELLPLAERLQILPTEHDFAAEFRQDIPDLPPGCKAYCVQLVDFMDYWPVFIFATSDDDVAIYVRRTAGRGKPGLVTWDLAGHRAEPVVVARRDVIDEIASFLSHYLDDLSDSFRFILEDEMYQQWRRRILALKEPATPA